MKDLSDIFRRINQRLHCRINLLVLILITILAGCSDNRSLIPTPNWNSETSIAKFIIKENAGNTPDKDMIDLIKSERLLAKIARKAIKDGNKAYALLKLSDSSRLHNIIRKCRDPFMDDALVLAVDRIQDPNILCRFACSAERNSVRERSSQLLSQAVRHNPHLLTKSKIERSLRRIAIGNDVASVRIPAVKALRDQLLLKQLALEESNDKIRIAAVGRITDQRLIEEILKNDKSLDVRVEAARNAKNQSLLYNTIMTTDNTPLAAACISSMTNQQMQAELALALENEKLSVLCIDSLSAPYLLANVALNSRSAYVSRSAIWKMVECQSSDYIDSSNLSAEDILISVLASTDSKLHSKYGPFGDIAVDIILPLAQILGHKVCRESFSNNVPHVEIQTASAPATYRIVSLSTSSSGWDSPQLIEQIPSEGNKVVQLGMVDVTVTLGDRTISHTWQSSVPASLQSIPADNTLWPKVNATDLFASISSIIPRQMLETLSNQNDLCKATAKLIKHGLLSRP